MFIRTQYLSKILLIIISLAAYGQTLQMYFWQDDYTIYYTAMQNKLFDYPYQINTLFVKMVMPFFRLHSVLYYALGLLLFIVVVFCTYYLLYTLTQDSLVAFWGAAITASGYIGQGAIQMFIGTGIAALPALILFLLSVSFLIQYVDTSRTIWISASLVCFFLMLESAPHRHATAIFVVVGVLLLHVRRSNLLRSLMISLMFCLLAVVELLIHPTKFIYYYQTGTMGNITPSLLLSLRPSHFENLFGTFWNLYMPSSLLVLPAGVTSLLGISLIAYICYRLSRKQCPYRKAGLILFMTITGSLLTFFISKPDTLYESDHRYLFSISYASALIPVVFWQKKKTNILAVSLSVALIVLHLSAGIASQYLFVHRYSNHARNIYTQLKNSVAIPRDSTTLIHIEATTRDLNLWAGDALRVGTLPSETALAVHYDVEPNNIRIIDTVKEFPAAIQDTQVASSQIYSYLYDGKVLHDVSAGVRGILSNKPLIVDTLLWQSGEDEYVYTSLKNASSQWPMTLTLHMQNDSFRTLPIHISWRYDTSGHPTDEKSLDRLLEPGKSTLIVRIPGGGTILDSIRVSSHEGLLITDSTLLYHYE